jgi:dihydrofolate synthase/folylpolyglutamate synthase
MNTDIQQPQEIQNAIQAFRAAERWLFTLITDPKGERYFQDKSDEVRQQEFKEQIDRMVSFMDFCGHPENAFSSIHVAGTSGKGSVVNFLASILAAGGYKTGYHVSPYLQVCNEKLIVDRRMIRPSEFAGLVGNLRESYQAWVKENDRFEALKYGEAWVALTYLWLAHQQVEWGVIETGLGGRYDPTNILQPRLAVITNVNFDHVEVLGETLEEIAWHKAGIIKPGGLAITAERGTEALAVIEAEAEAKGARLYRLGMEWDYQVDGENILTVQGVHNQYPKMEIAARGVFQLENAALAVAGLDLLVGAGELELGIDAVRNGLRADVPGRFEIIQRQPTVILDGAHNQHKARALADSLSAAYPGKKFTIVIGTLSIKDFSGIIRALAPLTGQWIVTQPKVFGKPAAPPEKLVETIRSLSPHAEISVIEQVADAIQLGLDQTSQDDLVVVTGSLYLLGEARGYWRSVDQILADLERDGTSDLI